jgi:polysaccharide pyruvyl transferase WcaK-like protein
VLDDMIHIGDEAMFDACVAELGSRGIHDIVGISSNPAETAARYEISAVARIGFDAVRGGSRAASTDRMSRVLRTATGETGPLEPGDPALAVIEAVRLSDGVVIAGGGNLSSLWPMHVFERATLGALARALHKPLVITGQTVGPLLDAADGGLVSALFSSARRVGLREPASFELTELLGVPSGLLTLTVDDASFLPEDRSRPATPDIPPYCLVTLANHIGEADRDTVVAAIAALLDHVTTSTGLDIVFSAHFSSTDPLLSRGDSVMHSAVASAMSEASSVIPTTDARASAALARGAGLVVASRYHPAVFAVAAGVPTIGIPVDDYTTVKLTGALGNLGQSSVLAVGRLVSGDGGALVDAVWADRDGIRSRGIELAQLRRGASTQWWDAVAAEFTG